MTSKSGVFFRIAKAFTGLVPIIQGVYRYDNKILTQFSISNGLADNLVLSIQEDQNGQLWFGTDRNGMFRFNGAKFYRFEFPNAATSY